MFLLLYHKFIQRGYHFTISHQSYISEELSDELINSYNSKLFCTNSIDLKTFLTIYSRNQLIEILNEIDDTAINNIKGKRNAKTITLIEYLITNHSAVLDKKYKNRKMLTPLNHFIEKYNTLLVYTRRTMNSYYIDTELCINCFQEKYNLVLNTEQYMYKNNYVLCDNCCCNPQISVSKDLITFKK